MKRNLKNLRKAVIASLHDTYDLVYVDRNDQLTREQVSAVVEGDTDTLYESTEEWESESSHTAMTEILTTTLAGVISTWEGEDGKDYSDLSDRFLLSKHEETVAQEIYDRNNSSYMLDLIRATPTALLRITCLGEDDAYNNQEVDPTDVLVKVGLPVTDKNVALMAATLAECSPEFSILMGAWIVGADLEQIYTLGDDVTQVSIHNPHLYLGNPFAGTGFISEEAFEGVVVVKREDLRTDKGAFGYGVEALYGGLNASDYEATIVPVVPRDTIEVTHRSPVLVAAHAGDGDIEVQVFYSPHTGRQVVQIDTEEHAEFEVLVNDGRVAIVSNGGDVVNRMDPNMNRAELLAIRKNIDDALAALTD